MNYEDKVNQIKEAARKQRRKSRVESIAAGVAVGILIVAAIAALIVFGSLITMLAWNLGVVAIVAAAGGSVGKIGLVTAFFANIAISIASRLFRGPVRLEASNKS